MATSKEKVNKKEEKKIEKIKNPGEADRKKKKTKLIFTFVFIFLIIFISCFSVGFSLVQKGRNTIVKGVSAKGINLSNYSNSDAKAKLAEELNKQIKTPIKLKFGDYSLDINLSEIEFKYDLDGAIQEAYNVGREENIIKSNYDILATMLKGKNIEVKYTYNEDALKKFIETVSTSIPGKTIEYTYCIDENELIITPGKDGVVVKEDALKELILSSIVNRDSSYENKAFQEIMIPVTNKKADAIDIDKIYAEVHCEPKDAVLEEDPFNLIKDEDGIDFEISIEEAKALITGDQEEYTIPLKITKANQTVADLGSKVFPQVLSEFSTNYNAGAVARTKNLQIAAGKIDGTIVMPGEEFSFNKVVGKRTVQDGYQNAPVYENGKVVDGLAGGICQISTTLYNAALLANLEITDRRNHNFVSTYVEAGRDATVVYGSQDLKFKNTRQYPIQINCSVSGGVAYFCIKGIKEETEYDVRILTSVTGTTPFGEEIEEDPSLEPGTKQVVQAGHNGSRVASYRILYLDGNEVSRTLLYNDTYLVMNRIVKVAPETAEAQEDETGIPGDLVVKEPVQPENNEQTTVNPAPVNPAPSPAAPAQTNQTQEEPAPNNTVPTNTTPAEPKPVEPTTPESTEPTSGNSQGGNTESGNESSGESGESGGEQSGESGETDTPEASANSESTNTDSENA